MHPTRLRETSIKYDKGLFIALVTLSDRMESTVSPRYSGRYDRRYADTLTD
jgi:hypothetical protein